MEIKIPHLEENSIKDDTLEKKKRRDKPVNIWRKTIQTELQQIGLTWNEVRTETNKNGKYL